MNATILIVKLSIAHTEKTEINKVVNTKHKMRDMMGRVDMVVEADMVVNVDMMVKANMVVEEGIEIEAVIIEVKARSCIASENLHVVIKPVEKTGEDANSHIINTGENDNTKYLNPFKQRNITRYAI